jgi:heme/copper-type cytochrome/quinol oxidase subunit 2
MCVSRNESITAVGGSMTKKLITATILIIIGEVLSLARVYFAEAMSSIPSIVTALLLVISIILEVVGIILLFICIANYDKK